jgi:hypothetical protein
MFTRTIDQKKALYLEVCAEAKETFARHNPCQIRKDPSTHSGVQCAAGTGGCCHGCKHLGPEGCTVESLACRLWVCFKLDNHDNLRHELLALRQAAYQARLPMDFRASLEENFA